MPAPSVQSIIRTGLRFNYGELQFRDFSGGLNLRDAAPELAQNESPDLYNVTLDERGGISKRLGFAKNNPTPFNTSKVANVYYWASGQNKITQSGTGLFKDDSTVAFKTFTTSARCGLADFQGKLYIIHPVDGMFSYDGTTVTTVLAGPKGSTLAPWQNKLWASADPNAKARVYFSAAGDGTKWYTQQTALTAGVTLPVASIAVTSTAGFASAGSITFLDGQTVAYTGITATSFTGCTGGSGAEANGAVVFQGAQNFNDLREKDSEAVVCLSGAAGLDVAGRPGLLAFKQRSTYRIFDSSNGSYQTIDPQVGAASALAVTNLFERTIALSEQGIFWTDGVGPLRPASDKLSPLFTPGQVDFTSLDNWCAGAKGDRTYFSLRRNGSSANDLMLEYHPLQGWFTANSNAATCYATYGASTQKLLSGSPSVNGQVYEQLTTGADDGTAITSRYQTKWIEPTQGHPVRITRLRITGRGIFAVNPIYDYALAPATSYSVNLVGTAAVYDAPAAVYDAAAAIYGPTNYKDTKDVRLNKVCKAVALQFSETSSTSSSALQILASGAAPEIGGWGAYGVDLSYSPLGLS